MSWRQNVNTGEWEKQVDSLDKEQFDFLRQELQELRFYSKCLDGTSYLPINNLDTDIYDILDLTTSDTWHLDATTYSIPTVGTQPINNATIGTYSKYLEEYGFTLKNLFTPERTIGDAIDNFLQVDVTTTETIENLTSNKPGLTIDNVILKEGHRVLVKDEQTFVTLSNAVDPDVFFKGNYSVENGEETTTDYSYFNELNGIYKYTNKKLVREDDLNDYDTNVRYSVHVKLGETNRQTQYHLSRLINGYFPITDVDPIEFTVKHNYLLRNLVEYTNVLEIDYEDIIQHDAESINIPLRTVAVGDFGQIVVHQDDILGIIKTEFKNDLKSISMTDTHYWCVGEKGTLLKISKVDFTMEKIDLGEFITFNAISFINNLRGFIVGDLGRIYVTTNGGKKWILIDIDGFDSFKLNDVLFYNLTTAYIAGNNGIFLKLTYSRTGWIINKFNINKIESQYDEFIILDDILNIEPFNDSGVWTPTYSFATSSSISSTKEGLILSGTKGQQIIYDINGFVPAYDFLFLDGGETETIRQTQFRTGTNLFTYITESDYKSIDINDYSTIDENTNILSGTLAPTVINESYNKGFDIGVGVGGHFVGDRGIFEGINSGATFSLDTTFFGKQKSKLLFTDYDMAGKLNWFDADLNYRLPSDGIASTASTSIELQTIPGDVSWLDYYKDSNKVFTYQEPLLTANEVLISSKFDTIGATQTNSATVSTVTGQLNDIIELAPSYGSTPSSPSAPTNVFDLYLYDNLLILRAPTNYLVDVGDSLYISNDTIDGTLLVNRIENLTDGGGNRNFIYCYSNFNETIVNDLVDETSIFNQFTITNLNKWEAPLDNYELHPISVGYNAVFDNTNITFTADFNNRTAYYNMEANVVSGTTSSMKYENTFLSFGYTAQYNLLDYLENINPTEFTSSKVYTALPQYDNIPEGNSTIVVADNRLAFDPSLRFEYESLFKNTFIDVLTFNSPITATTSQALITDKYYDATSDKYIIELNKEIETPVSIGTIDILSRNTLQQISEDLQELNNIHRKRRTKEFGSANFDVYERELNYKFYTDSYAKALLSDGPTKDNLTGIVYTDYKNEIAMNIIQLPEDTNITIESITDSGGTAIYTVESEHNLEVGDRIIVSGVTYSETYNGYLTVLDVPSTLTFATGETFSIIASNVENDIGDLTIQKFDPYLNYRPQDIIDVGISGGGKLGIEILDKHITNDGRTLEGVDLNKAKFRLVDGLDISQVKDRYSWLLEAEVRDAFIGEDDNGVVWYDGIWFCGRWFGGTWYKGWWLDGEWYEGNWHSVDTQVNILRGTANLKSPNNEFSLWFGGNHHTGTWHSGTWFDGKWVSGTWEDGDWFNGVWQLGTHNDGNFMGGQWTDGTWNNGNFSCQKREAFWLDGSWTGGDFECGEWFNGTWTQLDGKVSRFGTAPTNFRKAIWHGGIWFNGEFHSFLNLDDEDNTVASISNKLSKFETGKWGNGDFYGGTTYNIDWNNGTWWDGVSERLKIIELNSADNQITVSGEYYFNQEEIIYVINNNVVSAFTSVGTNTNIGKYQIKTREFVAGNTVLTVFENISVSASLNDAALLAGELRVVSDFFNIHWINGIWFNGLFEGDWRQGIWYNGVFKDGTWGEEIPELP